MNFAGHKTAQPISRLKPVAVANPVEEAGKAADKAADKVAEGVTVAAKVAAACRATTAIRSTWANGL